jgi:type I site-specific restriction endonuclease
VLTSVGILTTGFDEPAVESIILNRATRSLTLYFQMIGRGSRVIPGKDSFNVIDLGNNLARFGRWDEEIDWQAIFRSPDNYLQHVRSDDEIQRSFRYTMPPDAAPSVSRIHANIDFDMEDVVSGGAARRAAPQGGRSTVPSRSTHCMVCRQRSTIRRR